MANDKPKIYKIKQAICNPRPWLSKQTSRHLQAVLILIGLLVTFFWRFTLLGEAFIATDLYFNWPPWDSIALPGLLQHNPWITDRADSFYPARFFARETLHRGELPLWDPHVLCGRPLAATLHQGLLYPLELLLWLLPLDFALGLHAMLRLFLAGFFTYLFLRELDVGAGGALIGAIVFTYNSFHIIWLGVHATYPSAMAPLVFWLAERLIKRPNGTYACLLGLAIASMVAGGFVTAAAYFLYAVGVYYLLRVFQEWRSAHDLRTGLRRVALFALAVILGFLLIAPGVYGELEFVRVNNYVGQRIKGGRGLGHLSAIDFVRFFAPHYYGDPLGSSVYRSFPETTGYLGILPWLLAILALVCCWRKWATGYFAGLAFISYGMVYGLPFNRLIGRLPVLNAGPPTRMLVSGAFGMAVLAAIGFDFLQHTARSSQHRWICKVVLSTAATIVLILIATDLRISLESTHPWRSNTLIKALQVGQTTHFQVSNGLTLALWLLGGINIILARTKGWLTKRTFAGAAILLLTLDVFHFGIDYNPTLKPELVMPTTPGIEFLQQRQEQEAPFRILGLDSMLWPNSSAVYGLHDIRAHGMSTDRYETYIGKIDPTSQRGHHGTISIFSRKRAQLDSPLLDLLNVRYILVSPDTSLEQTKGTDDLILVYAGEDMHIYENPSHFPRAYAVCQFRVTQDEQAILNGLSDGSLDPRETVWLEEPPAIPGTNADCVSEHAQVIRYAANEFVIRADMAAPGFLVVSEVTYPGWRAYVDGEESHVYTANYLFRAVYLPAGTHEVRFAYVPIGFWIGVAISLATLAGIAGVLGRATWRRLRQRRAVKEAAP